jgi:hypothetical protein
MQIKKMMTINKEKQPINHKSKLNIFENFSLWEENSDLELFKIPLGFAAFNGLMDKKLSKYKRYENYIKEKYGKNKTFENILNKDNEIYCLPGKYKKQLEPFSDLIFTRIYLDILELISNQKNKVIFVEETEETNTEGFSNETFRKSIADAMQELLDTKLTAYIDKKFIEIFNDLAKVDKENFNIFVTETIVMFYKKKYYQTNGLTYIVHSTIASDLGCALLQFILTFLNNDNLNSFIEKLKGGFFNLNKNNVNMINEFLLAMESEEKKQEFMDNHFCNINTIYHEILMAYMYNLVYLSNKSQPDQLNVLAKEFSINTTAFNDIPYDKTFKARTLRMGVLIIDQFVKNKICWYTIKNEKQKTTGIVYLINADLLVECNYLYDINKPQISTIFCPLDILKTLAKESIFDEIPITKKQLILYEKTSEYKKKKVHAKEGITIHFNKNYQEHNYTPQIRYSVNHDMLMLFLSVLAKNSFPKEVNDCFYEVLNNFINNSANKSAEHILTFFDLSFKRIAVMLKKYPNTVENMPFHKSLYKIIRFMLTYSCIGYIEIKEELLGKNIDKKYNGFIDIKELLDKALQYKLNLIGLLTDSILYSRFKFWIANSFIDTRGRVYNTESFLNIQNNPTSRMFISLYQNEHDEISPEAISIISNQMQVQSVNSSNSSCFNLEYFKKQSENYINNKKTLEGMSENMKNPMLDLYVVNRKTYIDYIYSFFKPSLNEEDYKDFLSKCGYKEEEKENRTYISRGDQLNFITSNIKKLRKVWSVLHFIVLLCKRKPLIKFFVIDCDFSQSGPTNISVLSTNIQLAQEANLISNEFFDPYMNTLTQYKSLCRNLQRLRYEFVKNVNLRKSNSEKEQETIITTTMVDNLKSSTTIYKALLKCNLIESPGSCALLLKSYSLNNDFDFIPKDISNYYCLIPSIEYRFVKEITKDSKKSFKAFCMYILVLRVAFKMQVIYKKYPWVSLNGDIWKERDLFKRPVMTLYYNATKYTRINHFKKILQQYNRHNTSTLPNQDLLYVANSLELFFDKHSLKTFDGVNYMKKLTKILIEQQKPVLISNNYFNITFNPFVRRSIQVETKTLDKKRKQLSINIPGNVLDKKALALSLSPNIIHSMDAWIVHCFIDKIAKINKALTDAKINFKLTFSTNHDCFSTNFPALTPLLLKECVLDLITSNYIKNIKNLTESNLRELKSLGFSNDNQLFHQEVLNNTNPRFVK